MINKHPLDIRMLKSRTSGESRRKFALRRALPALLTAFFLIFSTGCSTFSGFSAEGTMRPPRPTGEKSAIYSVLETVAAGAFTLKYPTSGDYRSAIITEDLDGDNQQEAMAFYQKADEAAIIRVVFMRKAGDAWQSLGDFTNTATQVDKVAFGDVNGDGDQEVIIGWGSAQTGSTSLCVYSIEKGKMKELNLDQSYSQMAVMDFDGDGFDEIFTANVALGEQPALSSLFRIRSGAIEIMGTAKMDKTVTRYINMQVGLLNETQYGIVLDGARSNAGYVTEVVYWNQENKKLETPLLDENHQSVSFTVRTNNILSRDVNGDRIIELPIATILPGFTAQTAGETSYVTDWMRYDALSNTLERVMSTVTNGTDEYWFLIPDMWKGAITTEYEAETRSMTFYRWEEEDPQKNQKAGKGKPLLQIRVFTQKQWSAGKDTQGYFELVDNNNLVYAARNLSPQDDLSMSDSDVRNSFRLVKQE